MNATAVLGRPEHVTFQVVEGDAILIHMETGTYFSLNKIGTEFWQALDGRQSIAQHATALAQRYGVEEQVVIADLVELAADMASHNLLERIGPLSG